MAAILIEKSNMCTEVVNNIYILGFMIDYKMHCHLLKNISKHTQNELCNNGDAELNFFKDWSLEQFMIYKYINPHTKEDYFVYSSMNLFRRDIAIQQIGNTTIVSPLWALKEITCHIAHLLATNQIIILDKTKKFRHSNVKIAIRKNLFNSTSAYVLLCLDMCAQDPSSKCNPIMVNFSFDLMTIPNKKKYVLSNVEKKLPTLAFRDNPVFAFKTYMAGGHTSITAAPIRHLMRADKDIINYSVTDIHQKGYIQIVPDRMIVQMLQHATYIAGRQVYVSPEFAKKLESNELTTKYEHVTPQKSLLEWKIPPIHILSQNSTKNVSVNV
jgi:hypothetical protein